MGSVAGWLARRANTNNRRHLAKQRIRARLIRLLGVVIMGLMSLQSKLIVMKGRA